MDTVPGRLNQGGFMLAFIMGNVPRFAGQITLLCPLSGNGFSGGLCWVGGCQFGIYKIFILLYPFMAHKILSAFVFGGGGGGGEGG